MNIIFKAGYLDWVFEHMGPALFLGLLLMWLLIEHSGIGLPVRMELAWILSLLPAVLLFLSTGYTSMPPQLPPMGTFVLCGFGIIFSYRLLRWNESLLLNFLGLLTLVFNVFILASAAKWSLNIIYPTDR